MRFLVIAIGSVSLCAGCNGVSLNSDILNGNAGGGLFEREPVTVHADPYVPPTAQTEAPTGVTGRPDGPSSATVASLGDPSVPGLWLETPLVSQSGLGRVRTANGASIVVTLKPIAGDASAGSRLSIEGMRALGVPLTELVELSVQPLA